MWLLIYLFDKQNSMEQSAKIKMTEDEFVPQYDLININIANDNVNIDYQNITKTRKLPKKGTAAESWQQSNLPF